MSFTFPIIQKEGDFVNTITLFCLLLSMMAWKVRFFVGIIGAFCHHLLFCYAPLPLLLLFISFAMNISKAYSSLFMITVHTPLTCEIFYLMFAKNPRYRSRNSYFYQRQNPLVIIFSGHKCRYLFTLRHFHPISSKVADKSVLKT